MGLVPAHFLASLLLSAFLFFFFSFFPECSVHLQTVAKVELAKNKILKKGPLGLNIFILFSFFSGPKLLSVPWEWGQAEAT